LRRDRLMRSQQPGHCIRNSSVSELVVRSARMQIQHLQTRRQLPARNHAEDDGCQPFRDCRQDGNGRHQGDPALVCPEWPYDPAAVGLSPVIYLDIFQLTIYFIIYNYMGTVQYGNNSISDDYLNSFRVYSTRKFASWPEYHKDWKGNGVILNKHAEFD
jgi:hypothetical protein